MSTPNLPWLPGYIAPVIESTLLNAVTGVVQQAEQVIGEVVPGVLPPAPAPAPPSTPVWGPPPTVTPLPSVLPSGPRPPAGADWVTTAEKSALQAAESAMKGIAPQLQADLLAYAQQYLAAALTGHPVPTIPNVTIDGQSVTQTAARSHGWRTLLIGLGVSAASAVVTVIGQLNGIDLLSRDGWVATESLVVGAVISGMVSYLGRLKITPDYEQALLDTPPPRVGP